MPLPCCYPLSSTSRITASLIYATAARDLRACLQEDWKMTVCIVKGSLCFDVIDKIHSGTLQLRAKKKKTTKKPNQNKNKNPLRAWGLRTDDRSFRSPDCAEEINALGTTGTRICPSNSYLPSSEQSQPQSQLGPAARENHPAQILVTRLREPRPPPIRKKVGRAGRESWVPPTPVNFCELFLWKHPSQMKIVQSRRYFTAAKRVSVSY